MIVSVVGSRMDGLFVLNEGHEAKSVPAHRSPTAPSQLLPSRLERHLDCELAASDERDPPVSDPTAPHQDGAGKRSTCCRTAFAQGVRLSHNRGVYHSRWPVSVGLRCSDVEEAKWVTAGLGYGACPGPSAHTQMFHRHASSMLRRLDASEDAYALQEIA